MTTTRTAPRTCDCCNTRLHKENSQRYESICNLCLEQGGLENEHMDGYHDDEPHEDCPDCNSAVKDRTDAFGKTADTAPKSQGSHAACYEKGTHPKTRAGRAACRNSN